MSETPVPHSTAPAVPVPPIAAVEPTVRTVHGDAFQDDYEATTQAARRLCEVQAEVLAPGHGPALPMAAVREGLRSAHVPVDL